MHPEDLFRVETVETTAAPVGLEEAAEPKASTKGSWCRYVITNRSSRVVGRYRGTLAQTRRNAEELATSFNERASSNRSVWSPRTHAKRKPAAGRVKAKAPARAAH